MNYKVNPLNYLEEKQTGESEYIELFSEIKLTQWIE